LLGVSLGVALLAGWLQSVNGPQSEIQAGPPAAPQPPKPPRVYLLGDLSGEALVQTSVALQAADPEAVVLLDHAKCRAATKNYLDGLGTHDLILVGAFAEEPQDFIFDRQQSIACKGINPSELWQRFFPQAATVVVAPVEPRGAMLQAACLAGILKAPLVLQRGKKAELEELRNQLAKWQTKEVYVVGSAKLDVESTKSLQVLTLATESAVAETHLKLLQKQGAIRTVVVANAADKADGDSAMSPLAPWIALRKNAPLLLTARDGFNAGDRVRRATRQLALKKIDNVIYVGNLQRIPVECRPNPIPGDKDPHIDMEPLTPEGLEPTSFCIGRLFHEYPAVVPLMLARGELLHHKKGGLKALVVSNPGESLPLLETFSRNTVKELRNCGLETKAMYGKAVNMDLLRKEMPNYDVFLWEGHHNTLIRDWCFPEWDEPLPPSLVFLQSCLALKEWKMHPLLTRGAVGIIGSSSRTYSASGGATSLAFFDALMYDELTVGASLRQAKNFLLAYAMLKEKRLGTDATRTGANLRAAWAFTLWGDPTLELPHKARPHDALPAVNHEVKGNVITLKLPQETHDKIISTRYQSELPPNGRMAGLLKKEMTEDGQPLVAFAFAEVSLPKAPNGMKPVLHGKVPSRYWVFNWDARRKCGFLLVTPRPQDKGDLRFRVEYQPVNEASTD